MGECYLAEGKVTNADYIEYLRVVGAPLRLPPSAKAAFPGAPKRLDIDTAETTWLIYREQACRAMIYQWEGGTLGRVNYPKCLLTVTWDHMNELADLYSGLWHNGRVAQCLGRDNALHHALPDKLERNIVCGWENPRNKYPQTPFTSGIHFDV